MWPLLKTFSWQEITHHPWRTAVAVLATLKLGIRALAALLVGTLLGCSTTGNYPPAVSIEACVAETDEEAERLYSEHVSYFYNRCLHVYPGFADAPGYRTIKTIQTGALSQ